MASETKTLTEEEYGRWLHPAEAVALLSKYPTKYHIISHRLQDGRLRAVAASMIFQGRPGVREILAQGIWARWGFLDDDGFWTAAETILYPAEHSPGYHVYGVRFDPDGIALLSEEIGLMPLRAASGSSAARVREAGDRLSATLRALYDAAPAVGNAASPHPATNDDQASKPVQLREVEVWFNGLTPEEQAMGIRELWAAARAAHPGRRLPRKLVEPFVRGRQRGPRSRT